ncbi:MAG: DUF1570 domain-containing protein, partial [Planctomycetes bacterium]|nr:DUF1570 domain-containing protein [Planctomycetota bacterium]
CSADFIVYRLPGSDKTILLEGKAKNLGQGVIEYTHPNLGSLAFSRDTALVIKAPTRQEEFKKVFAKARQSKEVSDYLSAANLALRHGLLPEFRECCSEAYKLNPTDPTVVRLVEARRRIKRPLTDQESAADALREIVKLPSMKIALSDHYVLLHDTGDAKQGRRRKSRAEQRLELLEMVYESYFMKFALDGVLLEPPQERMKVILFGEERDYLRYSTQLDPKLRSALGFWSPTDNAAVFFDQGTTERMKALEKRSKELHQEKMRARGTPVSKEIAHMANTVELLVKLIREEDDIEVVSHEATHQLAGNTGLMPRGKIALRWAHEGFATYFETSSDAGWGGIGAVNEGRLKSYYRVSSDPNRAPIELLISDLLFDVAQDTRQVADAYGQAWALTHFLMERHFLQTVKYYQKISQIESESGSIPRRDLVKYFEEIFGDLKALQIEWHEYMRSLKTDLDRAREAMN